MAIGSNGPGVETRTPGEGVRTACESARRAHQRDVEIEKLISDIEALIAQIGQPPDPAVARLFNGVKDAVGAARQALGDRGAQLQQRAREAFDAGDSYVRTRPWQMIGAAAVAGVVLGLLVSRR
jgi:ElaB/YqjD/DUF883 family membrane-anchored ribosome-binding protein